jgi:hypothetical protein
MMDAMVMPRLTTYRCVGSLHRPLGDCSRSIAGALLCYGFLDRDQGVPLEDSIDGPVPMLFPSCEVHRAPLVDWAWHLWGDIAEGAWITPAAIPVALRSMGNQGDTVVISPDPKQAVRIMAA